MPEREIKISEMLEVGREGQQLLSLAALARISFVTEERGGRHVARFGGPNTITLHGSENPETVPESVADDLSGAIRGLFMKAAISCCLIESAPPPGAPPIKIFCRYKNGRFAV